MSHCLYFLNRQVFRVWTYLSPHLQQSSKLQYPTFGPVMWTSFVVQLLTNIICMIIIIKYNVQINDNSGKLNFRQKYREMLQPSSKIFLRMCLKKFSSLSFLTKLRCAPPGYPFSVRLKLVFVLEAFLCVYAPNSPVI